MTTSIEQLLADKADYLLNFKDPKVSKERLHLPGPDFVDRIFAPSDRNNRVLTNLERFFGHGRLSHTGYLSILPVDQGIEHSAGARKQTSMIVIPPHSSATLVTLFPDGCPSQAGVVSLSRGLRMRTRQ